MNRARVVVLLSTIAILAAIATAVVALNGTAIESDGDVSAETLPATTATAIPMVTETPPLPTPAATLGAGAPTATPAAQPAPTSIVPSTATSTPAVDPTPSLSTPVVETVAVRVTDRPERLRIPSLGIDSVVQWVGLDDQGRMDTPSNYVDTAWYEHGPRPGMQGNAVIAGHLDSATGPAVFYRLGDLRPGDEIIVVASDGEELRFVVEASESYHVSDAPLSRIFGPAGESRLNLITCSGRFDRSVQEYDQRLVVYTKLANTAR
jgi:sortase (surface protein transpeptidase)